MENRLPCWKQKGVADVMIEARLYETNCLVSRKETSESLTKMP
jgi:hypothetical protein